MEKPIATLGCKKTRVQARPPLGRTSKSQKAGKAISGFAGKTYWKYCSRGNQLPRLKQFTVIEDPLKSLMQLFAVYMFVNVC
jgi:hypothetical protein